MSKNKRCETNGGRRVELSEYKPGAHTTASHLIPLSLIKVSDGPVCTYILLE